MKGWRLWVCTALMLSAAVTGALLTATPLPPAESAEQTVYRVLGEWDGRVAVFLPQSTSPEQVYDTWVSSLPDADRARLSDGIAVYSAAELQRAVEDYTS